MADGDFNASLTNVANPRGVFNKGVLRGIILVPKDATIATKALAGTIATFTTGINLAEGSRWYVINFTKGCTNFGATPSQDEPVAEDTMFGGIRTFVRDGNKRTIVTLNSLTDTTKAAIRSLNGKIWEMLEIYDDYIRGRTILGTIVEGFHVTFHAGNEDPSGGGDTTDKFNLYIDYTIPGEADDHGITCPLVDFETEDLDGIENVYITEVSASTTAIVVDVKTIVGDIPFTDLVDADFILAITSTGVVVAHSGTAESTTVEGRYTISGTFTEVAHTLKTADQPDATTKNVETPTAGTVTPSS